MSALSKKALIAGIAVAISAIIYLLNVNQHFSHKFQFGNNLQTEKERLKPSQTQDIKDAEPTASEVTFNNNFAEGSVINNIIGRCGYRVDDFYLKGAKTDISEMTQRQLNSFEKLEEVCLDWYDHLDKTDIQEIQKNREGWIKEYENYLEVYTEEQVNSQLLLNAVNDIKKGINETSDFRMIESQLIYLLHFDTELQLKIGEELGTSSLEFIRSLEGAIYTSQLVICYYSDCGPNSFNMLRTCLSYDEFCGMSVQQHLQNRLTYSQFTDWQNAADVLYRLIETNWFSERELLNPTDP